ncbi:MAG: hypothetical protein IJJ26_08235 [Victivallales bacterium]|nr:hypothetical protein [Victivallales bacterium]
MLDSSLFQIARHTPPWVSLTPTDAPSIHLATRLLIGRNAATAVETDEEATSVREKMLSVLTQEKLWDKGCLLEFPSIPQSAINLMLESYLIPRDLPAPNNLNRLCLLCTQKLDQAFLFHFHKHFFLQKWYPGMPRKSQLTPFLKKMQTLGEHIPFRPAAEDAHELFGEEGFDALGVFHLPAISLLKQTRYFKEASQALSFHYWTFLDRIAKDMPIFVFSPSPQPGRAPYETLLAMQTLASQITELELNARTLLAKSYTASLYERVTKTVDTLRQKHSSLSFNEAISHLSLLWLATEMGMCPQISISQILFLFPRIFPQRLRMLHDIDTLTPKNFSEDSLRASFIRRWLF